MTQDLEERLQALVNKVDGDRMNADDLDTLVEGIRYAIEHGGNVSVVTTPLAGGGGYKITITDSEGVAHNAEVRDGGDAYAVYESTVPEGQTPMSKTEWLASLKGADGQNGAPGNNGHNPCLGRYDTLPAVADLPETPRVGDYIYVDDKTDPTNVVTTLYKYDATSQTGFDQGTLVDANNLSFNSGQDVIDVAIKDLGGEDAPAAQGVMSAEAGKSLADITTEIKMSDNILDPYTLQYPNGTTTNAEGDTVAKFTHFINTENGEVYEQYTGDKQYGYTDFIPFGEHNDVTINLASKTGSAIVPDTVFRRAACVYDSGRNFLEYRSLVSDGRLTVEKGSHNGTPYAYVRFNLGNPENLHEPGYAVYYDLGVNGELPPYVPFHKERVMKPATLQDNSVTSSKIADGAVTVDKISPLEEIWRSANICNPEDVTTTSGKFVSKNTGVAGSGTSQSAGGYTGYVKMSKQGLFCNYALTGVGGSAGWATYRVATEEEIADGSVTKFDIGGVKHVFCYGANTANIPYDTTINGEPTYARITLNINWEAAADIMVSEGQTAVEYEEYLGTKKVISKEILPDFAPSASPEPEPQPTDTYLDGVSVVLPPEIVITKGDVLRIYYRSIISAINPYNDFDINCFCGCVGSVPRKRYFEIDTRYSKVVNGETITVLPGSYPLTVVVRDNAYREIASATTTIKVINPASNPSQSKNVMVIGASTLFNCEVVAELQRRIKSNSGDGTPQNPTGLGLSNVNFIGARMLSVDNVEVHEESKSGWKWKDYATEGRDAYRFYIDGLSAMDVRTDSKYTTTNNVTIYITEVNKVGGYISGTYTGSNLPPSSGTLTKTSGNGLSLLAYQSYEEDAGNPFWNNGGLDFQNYMTVNSISGNIDVLITYLGLNDFAQSYTMESCVNNYVKPFIDALKSDYPNVKVILCTVHPYSVWGIGAESSAEANVTYLKKLKRLMEYVSALNTLVNDDTYSSFVTIGATAQEFDAETCFPTDDFTVNNRSTVTEELQTKGIHVEEIGEFTIADAMFHALNNVL